VKVIDPWLSPAGRQESLNPIAKDIRHYPTHSPLTGTGPQPELLNGLRLDAIVVPATRPAGYLDQALTLARDAGCWLVVLCSGQLDAAGAREYADARSRSYGKVVIVDLPAEYSHELLHFPRLGSIKSELPQACDYYTTDLSIKRNIGLILARMLKWHRIFFLDDDIRDVTYSHLQSTVDMLGSYSAAGLWITEFPDNSIVCHANRMTGEEQDVFVSGAALAVNCDTELCFFPDIYNEDWLFFFDYASQGDLANSQLKVTQLEYSPFARPQRAAWQEFGDLIAEGLYSLVHCNLPIERATREYWEVFLGVRRAFLEGIIARAQAPRPDIPEELTTSVGEAVKTLLTIQPELCERYVQAWREDMVDWKKRVADLPEMPSIEAALHELGLTVVRSAGPAGRTLPRQEEVLPRFTAGPVVIPLSGAMREMSQRVGMAAVTATDAGHPVGERTDFNRRRWWRLGIGRPRDRVPSVDRAGVPAPLPPAPRPVGSTQQPVAPSADAGEPALALTG
jgi:hypothetical protein